MKTPLIIEQHLHGAYGVDFNKAGVDDIVALSYKLRKIGIGGFFPTLVTDSVENTKRQIGIIKEAAAKCSGILGIHLEGIFINSAKKGIHNPEHFLPLTVDNFKKIEDDFIKIVTLAPELDEGLIDYLKSKSIKVQAGHCTGWGNVDGATHTFNADHISIGDDTIIAAQAGVTKSFPAKSIVVGAPAVPRKEFIKQLKIMKDAGDLIAKFKKYEPLLKSFEDGVNDGVEAK